MARRRRTVTVIAKRPLRRKMIRCTRKNCTPPIPAVVFVPKVVLENTKVPFPLNTLDRSITVGMTDLGGMRWRSFT